MKRTLWTLALGLLVFAPASGQQQEPATPVIKSRAELVLVPTVVTQDGKPVRGLQAKDFILLNNGQTEKVEVFEEIDATPSRVEQVNLPPRTVQNYAPGDSRQDVVILFLDYLNGSWSTRARIRSYLRDMTRQFAEAHTPVSVFVLSQQGLVQLHSFASDLGNLSKAIEQWHSGKPGAPEFFANWASPFSPTETAQTSATLRELDLPLQTMKLGQATTTADAMQQISEAYRGIPGRKKLIWMSIGFLRTATPAYSLPDLSRAATELKSQLNATQETARLDLRVEDLTVRAWKSLSDANITVYPIDSNGVVNPSWEDHFSPQNAGTDKFEPPTRVEVRTDTQSLLQVAEQTGGRACTSLPTECVRMILNDGIHYYVLGFYLHGENRPGWHKLRVSVNQSNVDVRTRDGFAVGVGPSATPVADKGEILSALLAPLDYTSVPLQLSWSVLSKQGNETQIDLALVSPPGGIAVDPDESRINVEYLAFIRPFGKAEGLSFPVTLTTRLSPVALKIFEEGGFRFRKQVTLAPGRYEVRVLLRDNVAKKMGTVSTLIDLSPTPAPAPSARKP